MADSRRPFFVGFDCYYFTGRVCSLLCGAMRCDAMHLVLRQVTSTGELWLVVVTLAPTSWSGFRGCVAARKVEALPTSFVVVVKVPRCRTSCELTCIDPKVIVSL